MLPALPLGRTTAHLFCTQPLPPLRTTFVRNVSENTRYRIDPEPTRDIFRHITPEDFTMSALPIAPFTTAPVPPAQPVAPLNDNDIIIAFVDFNGDFREMMLRLRISAQELMKRLQAPAVRDFIEDITAYLAKTREARESLALSWLMQSLRPALENALKPELQCRLVNTLIRAAKVQRVATPRRHDPGTRNTNARRISAAAGASPHACESASTTTPDTQAPTQIKPQAPTPITTPAPTQLKAPAPNAQPSAQLSAQPSAQTSAQPPAPDSSANHNRPFLNRAARRALERARSHSAPAA